MTQNKEQLLHELQCHQIELEVQNEELKSAQLELVKSRDRYLLLYNHSPVGHITLSEKGIITECNNTACRMLMKSSNELISLRFITLIAPQYHEAYYQLRNYLKTHTAAASSEIEFLRGDNKTLFVKLDSQRYKEGDNYEFHMILSDITEKKQMELVIQDQIKRIADHKMQLSQHARINTAGELVTSIAHEINQPLMSALNYIGGCLIRLKKTRASKAVIAMLENAMTETEKAGRIIHSLKDFIRKGTLLKTQVDLNILIKETIDCFSSDIRANNITLQLCLCNNVSTVEVDKLQIMQVLTNLFQNAIDSMTSINNNRMRLLRVKTASTTDNKVIVDVIDRGEGIPSLARDRIFSPFFTTKPDGIGLGLAMSYSIVQAHGGEICAYSEDQGTRFRLTLPGIEGTHDQQCKSLHH